VPCRTSGAPPTRPGAAITRPTSWWVTVRYARRGRNAPRRSRERARGDSRPGQGPPARGQRGSPAVAAAHRPAPRAPTTRGVAHTVACHAEGAGLPEDRGTPHVLRHTVCTHPADAGDVGTSRRLAGRADTRTTTIYIAVSDARLEHTIAERTRQRNRLRRAATAD
jgi:integrase